jgi:hypothetical protein
VTNATLGAELDRLVLRVAALGPARLGRLLPDGAETRATAVHHFAQRIADAVARAEGEPARRVPRLADHASADQLAVLTRDLLEVAARLPEATAADLSRSAGELRRRL